MCEKLEREAVGGSGSTGTKVSETQKRKEPVSALPAVAGRSGFRHLDNTTTPFFFTNFPGNATKEDLRRLFTSFGRVEEVFIPNKMDKWGRRFGFDKFREVSDEEDLGKRLEEVWLWKSRLKVNRARFGRDEAKAVERKVEERKDEVQQYKPKVGGSKKAFVTDTSYKGVVLNEVGIGVGWERRTSVLRSNQVRI